MTEDLTVFALEVPSQRMIYHLATEGQDHTVCGRTVCARYVCLGTVGIAHIGQILVDTGCSRRITAWVCCRQCFAWCYKWWVPGVGFPARPAMTSPMAERG
jgi:hypothetical protein